MQGLFHKRIIGLDSRQHFCAVPFTVAWCGLSGAEDANHNKKLTGSELHTLLLFYGVEKKNQSKIIGDMIVNYARKIPPQKSQKMDWCQQEGQGAKSMRQGSCWSWSCDLDLDLDETKLKKKEEQDLGCICKGGSWSALACWYHYGTPALASMSLAHSSFRWSKIINFVTNVCLSTGFLNEFLVGCSTNCTEEVKFHLC